MLAFLLPALRVTGCSSIIDAIGMHAMGCIHCHFLL